MEMYINILSSENNKSVYHVMVHREALSELKSGIGLPKKKLFFSNVINPSFTEMNKTKCQNIVVRENKNLLEKKCLK
jgi:hypothetical protein